MKDAPDSVEAMGSPLIRPTARLDREHSTRLAAFSLAVFSSAVMF